MRVKQKSSGEISYAPRESNDSSMILRIAQVHAVCLVSGPSIRRLRTAHGR